MGGYFSEDTAELIESLGRDTGDYSACEKSEYTKEFNKASEAGEERGFFAESNQENEYGESLTFMSADKSSGVSVNEDGDIISVFSSLPDAHSFGDSAS